jgi:hypothetical protein
MERLVRKPSASRSLRECLAVEVAGPEELIKTLETIKTAVEAGELDGQIEAASQSLSAGFQK